MAAQTLGRPLAGTTPNITVNLIAPGTLYGDRVNEVDFRIAKVLRFGRTRTNVGFDIYNVLNANPVLTYNGAFTPILAVRASRRAFKASCGARTVCGCAIGNY